MNNYQEIKLNDCQYDFFLPVSGIVAAVDMWH